MKNDVTMYTFRIFMYVYIYVYYVMRVNVDVYNNVCTQVDWFEKKVAKVIFFFLSRFDLAAFVRFFGDS